MRTLTILTSVLYLTLGACNYTVETQLQDEVRTVSADFIPLSEGNWWRYTSIHNPDTNAYWEWKVNGNTILSNKTYHILTRSPYELGASMGSRTADTSYLRYDLFGNLLAYCIDSSKESIIFAATYTVIPSDSSILNTPGRYLVSDTGHIEAPAGNFENCFVFQLNSVVYDSEPIVQYVAPGVGYISMGSYGWNLTLKSYHVASK